MNTYQFILKMSALALMLTINAVSFGMIFPTQYQFKNPLLAAKKTSIPLDMRAYKNELQNAFDTLDNNIVSHIQQPDNSALIKIRANLGDNAVNYLFQNPSPSIKIVNKEKPHERFGQCAYYAITTILGIRNEPGILKMILPIDWTTNINLMQYFDQTYNPKIDDLVIYYRDQINQNPLHFGIVTNFNSTNNSPSITSKWGTLSEIFKHELFTVPLLYGETVRFFTLKSTYQQEGRKTVLINELQSAIEKSQSNTENLDWIQNILLNLADGKNIQTITIVGFAQQKSIQDKVSCLLKAFPGLDIDTCNRSNHYTALMFATMRNDHAMADLLIKFGADINKQDKEGNTALSMAQKLNHHKIVELLQEKEKNLK